MEENHNTLAEISSTTQENIIPVGSIIILKIIGVDEIDIIFHSTKIVFEAHVIAMVYGRIIISINHIILLAMSDR
jgi:hypothetical protein